MDDECPRAIDIRGVEHRYAAAVALAGVTLDIRAGTATAVVGPDGVGKSTLLGLIAGVRRLQSGTLQVLGGDMTSRAHRDRVSPRIAYMPQGLGRNLYPSLSVFENVDFSGRLFGLSSVRQRARIERLLAATGLDRFSDRAAGRLSGGMKQKLSLCAALVHDPDLLILDEPTTGIDPLSRRQFWSLIDALRSERPGMTLLVSTADMDEAERFQRVLAIDAGRILADGTADEIKARAGAASLEDAFVTLRDPGLTNKRRRFEMQPRVHDDGPPVIKAERLTRRFGDFVAVDHVSFSIPRGEIFGFLGSNGCGKTTTMKMLTGLLPATGGTAELFGRPIAATDVETRLHVGYMSQSFSLYEELSVRANLDLHARLYRIASAEVATRVAGALERFGITDVADAKPAGLPLGIRQRLQLAAACLHRPAVLILDEPTSGVDPVARDSFWAILVELSRQQGVTIFISTHFMNEAERCDRVSLMHEGKVLAVGAPVQLAEDIGVKTLQEAFIAHLERLSPEPSSPIGPQLPRIGATAQTQAADRNDPNNLGASVSRIWAFARREAQEILRDPIRLAFAFLGPLILLITFGYGITFDVDRLAFAALDRDRSAASREFIEAFSGSRYFREHPPIDDERTIDQRLRSGELQLVMSVPPAFGSDLLAGRRPEIGFFLDGANTFRAETARGYIQGTVLTYGEQMLRQSQAGAPDVLSVRIEPRYRYNQAFRSAFAIVPGSIMMILALIPSTLAALGVVREREIGSISNLYCSPATVGEFLIGKQLPYVLIGYASFLSLVAAALLQFGLTIKGSPVALMLGGLLFVFAMTGFGLFVSSFVKTQIAALIATPIISVVPSIQFSGYLIPAATLEGPAFLMGHGFPALWFQNISLGTFAKGHLFSAFYADLSILLAFGVGFLIAACLILKKQER